jgi:hypothetical protein
VLPWTSDKTFEKKVRAFVANPFLYEAAGFGRKYRAGRAIQEALEA